MEFAFLLCFLAGISTSIGGILAFFIKKENVTALSLGLGFSAGVMIYVSFMEILNKSHAALLTYFSSSMSDWVNLSSFFAGIFIAALIDRFLPDTMNQDQLNIEKEKYKADELAKKLKRTGVFTALAIAIHNFPEGLATFMAGMTNPTLGISIAVAIAIHNIPEGIAVSLPIYRATGSKKKAFWLATLSGLSEPLGAIVGFTLLSSLFNGLTFGVLFAAVAGIMVYISFDELIPTAREYGKGHTAILGVTLGMFVMAVSLILLK